MEGWERWMGMWRDGRGGGMRMGGMAGHVEGNYVKGWNAELGERVKEHGQVQTLWDSAMTWVRQCTHTYIHTYIQGEIFLRAHNS